MNYLKEKIFHRFIGKTKTISKIAYELWKLEKREPEYRKKRGY